MLARCAGAMMAAVLFGSGPVAGQPAPLSVPNARLEPVDWRDLDGWNADDHLTAFKTFLASCRALGSAPGQGRVLRQSLARVCKDAVASGVGRSGAARAFFERQFRPVRVLPNGTSEGFLTGYYEPVVEGSLVPTPEFRFPLYRKPDDLSADAVVGGVRPDIPGSRTAYYDRAAIEDGALAGRGLEICWLKDPTDAFFIHIQGSARIRLPDGRTLRVNYAARNGLPYTAVGGVLIARGEIPRAEMSMQRIREWMQAHPQESAALRRQNRSYVFFRVTPLREHDEAIGAQGVPLTAGRSLAVDQQRHVYGTPFWIEAELPLTGDDAQNPFRRLMIAQDTGTAIVGPARADIYFGTGEAAARVAGRIRHPGRFVMLVPRDLAAKPEVSTDDRPRPRP